MPFAPEAAPKDGLPNLTYLVYLIVSLELTVTEVTAPEFALIVAVPIEPPQQPSRI